MESSRSTGFAGFSSGFLSPSSSKKATKSQPEIVKNTAEKSKPIKEISETAISERGIEPIIIKAEQFETISFSQQIGGQIIEIPNEGFFGKPFLLYSESLHGNASDLSMTSVDLRDAAIKSKELLGKERHELLTKQTIERLKTPLDSFVVSPMESKNLGSFGYGLFAKADIEKDTVLFLYSGQLEPDRDCTENQGYSEIFVGKAVINAAEVGGLARFMQHLPRESKTEYYNVLKQLEKDFETEPSSEYSEKELKRLAKSFGLPPCKPHLSQPEYYNQLKDLDKQFKAESPSGCSEEKLKEVAEEFGLAIANVETYQVLINDILVNVCQAIKKINKGEIIGFDYRFDSKHDIAYFYKDGKPFVTMKNHF